MSEILKDRAVILKNFEYGESSIVAVALTREHGKVTFLAKGARSGKNPLQGRLRTGNVADVVYYGKAERAFQLIKEISVQPGFDSGCMDLDRLCIFQAGLEVMDRSTVGIEADRKMFDLLQDFIGCLGGCADPWTAFFAFEVQLLGLTGLYPSFEACTACKKDLAGEDLTLDPTDGGVFCLDCSRGSFLELSAASAGMLSMMETSGLEGVGPEPLDAGQRREIGRVLHNMFLQHVEGYRLPNALKILKGAD